MSLRSRGGASKTTCLETARDVEPQQSAEGFVGRETEGPFL